MTRRQAFKFELIPNGAQERALRRFAGCCCFVYNKALALQIERREHGEKHIAPEVLREVYKGVDFVDGVAVREKTKEQIA